MNNMNPNRNELEKKIKISFKNKELLENVFIHRSYLNENRTFKLPSNEKLEFLGDSVLSLTTSIYLYKNYSHLQEGDYTDIKASVVRTESLALVSRELKLGQYLYLSVGEEKGNGREKTNILADVFESLIAGIFIDKGFDTAYDFIVKYLFSTRLDEIITKKLYLSPKSRLQEISQATYKELPIYNLLLAEGPEHKKTFTVEVMLKNKKVGSGSGKSKKHAEELAAQNALDVLAQ
ncbi:ribonuclease III [Candidatus Roizmanbacteria bacterium CG_4_9_14_0_2_um_filter_39_13]|uniref:Ribonuclease 3 n=1 Tax=Candidatus Roizmanbacteria bacterium CG_4_9_14_0_2_um_filter_39_13 TaxID=1974839 RepID=A0A2M8EYS4_9BACT|nr:MAG: ribonuclease III [Candidatus Roizmanbacteria bacterium CG_4_10_14_0_2_um_filter_39_12]PJC31775.1 MAG: ribonuclease III [Candidatus Roizmanbacteria bacterium CG_4_9_14_0_2_um_filter_39_13]